MGLLPNPLLTFEIDDFGGSKFYRGFKHAEYTLSLTQPIDLSGKRNARQGAALATICKIYWNGQALRQRIAKELKEAFINAAALQEHLKLTSEQHRLTQDCLASTEEKAALGKIPSYQCKKASIACNVYKLTYEKAQSDYSSALSAIAALLSEPCITCDGVSFSLHAVNPLEPYCSYEGNLENNPELAAARMNVYIANQVHKLELASRIPDLNVTASISNYNEISDNAFSLSFSIPIPVFDRNEGSICRSSWETLQTNYMQQDLEIHLRTRLMTAYQRLKQSYEAVRSLEGDMQSIKETLNAAHEGYKQGKIELIDLLDTQRTCNEITDHYIDALKDYHLWLIEVESIAPPCRA
jgi:cobalt-zinc-cadmium efflux system outer membrane protein